MEHLEIERHNSPRTRNARLAAIRSFFRFAALRHREHAAVIARVLAIPTKRCDCAVVCFLTEAEADAVVASPDQTTWTGRRDHALLLVALQTGLRVSELTGLANKDLELRAGAHVRCWGKGRKERCTPLRRSTCWCYGPGRKNGAVALSTRCPPHAAAPASGETRWKRSSTGTPPSRPPSSHRCGRRT